MDEYKFLAEIINRNWFKQGKVNALYRWSFPEDIAEMSGLELEKIILLVFECLKIKAKPAAVKETVELINADNYSVFQSYDLSEDIKIDKEFLSKFLNCITLSEYGISSILLYPADIRFQKIKEISDSIGISEQLFTSIDANWHETVRKKIFRES